MATLAAMLADVYSLTKRPDLVTDTTLAVKAATLKAHQVDFFPRDIIDQPIQFITQDFLQAVDVDSILTRYRALSYIRKYDTLLIPQPDDISRELTIITPDNIFDSYWIMKSDVAYQAGALLNIKSSTSILYAILGYYQNPDLSYVAPSWISDKHPYAIIFEAAAIIFKTIGYDEMSAKYRDLNAEQIAMLRSTNILTKGS